MSVLLKIKTTRPDLQEKFFFECFIDWEQRPWVEAIEAGLASQPGLIRATLEEHCPREELVARRDELRDDLKFMADDCMDFEPEYLDDPLMSGWPSWGADMSPPFNPFSLTFTTHLEFDTVENALNWYNNLTFPDDSLWSIKELISTHNNTIEEHLFVDGIEVPFTSKINT